MQEIVEAAKRAANIVAERAAWEADRLRRLTSRQKEVDLAKRERGTLLEQVARTMLDLQARGQLSQGPLVALCNRLRELDQEIATGSTAVKTMRGEQFKAGAFPPGSVQQPALGAPRPARMTTCPTCHQAVREDAAFCSACGTRLR
ncbi:MAG TPA: zinc ribbon domain-containing protein [Ktedonobacterales bacterium]|jgi:hypothetical protein